MKTIIDFYDILRLPLKNIWRNRRRTVITMAGIALASLCLILFGGYIRMMEVGLMDNAINKQFGYFQIARTGFFNGDTNAAKYLIPIDELEQVENKLLEMDQVSFVNRRLHLFGIIGNQEDSTVFSGLCGIPEFETMMSPALVKGKPLSESDPNGIVIGRAMAKKLNVDLGDSLLLFFSSEDGAQEAINVTVRGIYRGIAQEQEKIMIYIPIETAWDLMLEKKAHRLLVFLNSKNDIQPVVSRIKRFIARNHLDLEVRTWDKLAVFQRQVVNMFKGILAVAGVILSVIIIFNISNTMYMTISERTREIGTMRALGDGALEIMRLLFLEGLYMGLIGAITGSVLANLLTPVINRLNLVLPPGPGQVDPIPIRIVFDLQTTVIVCICAVLVASLASLIPSFKATRIKIAEALRYA